MLHTIDPDDLDRIVLDTLALFVGGNTEVAPDWAPQDASVVATVRLDGTVAGEPVCGVVAVVADAASSACITGSMMGMAAELCDPADVTDVMGEVANVVGGNVKACLGDGLQLGLPEVGAAVPAAVPVARRGYRFDGLGIAVALFDGVAGGAA